MAKEARLGRASQRALPVGESRRTSHVDLRSVLRFVSDAVKLSSGQQNICGNGIATRAPASGASSRRSSGTTACCPAVQLSSHFATAESG